MATTSLVATLLLLVLVAAGSAWTTRREVVEAYRGTLGILRADQLARAAAAEAFSRLSELVNDPRSGSGPGQDPVLDSWFRAVRPPGSSARLPAELVRATLPVPRAAELASREGFLVSDALASCAHVAVVGGISSGQLDVRVLVSGTSGRLRILRQLEERRTFWLHPAHPTLPVFECLVSGVALGRVHESL